MTTGSSRMVRHALVALLLVASGCVRVDPASPPPAPADLPPPSGERPLPPAGEPEREPAEVPPPGDDAGTPPDRAIMPPDDAIFPPDAVEGAEGVGGAEARDPALPPLRLPPVEVRGLWVVRTALTHPDSARIAVQRAADAGFNTLFVQVRGRGDAYYRSPREPRAAPLLGLPDHYDPLQVVLDEAHARGIAVHAWVNMNLVASALLPPTAPDHLARSRPDLLAVPRELAPGLHRMNPWDPRYFDALAEWTVRNAERVEGIYSSPSHPEAHEHLVGVVSDLLRAYPLDGLHLDYIRYPSPDFDYSRSVLEDFRGWVRVQGVDVRWAESRVGEDPFAYVDHFPALWDRYRQERVTELVRTIYLTARALQPELVVSAAVFASAADARNARYQAWEGWLRTGIVDAVAPMAYTTSEERFAEQIARASTAAGGRRVWAGLGIYQDTFEGAVRKARLARSLGVGGVTLFSYDWAVDPDGGAGAVGAYLDRFSSELWGVR
jgi:uncharacterized lipoprotein YddW (UPF0748 family)